MLDPAEGICPTQEVVQFFQFIYMLCLAGCLAVLVFFYWLISGTPSFLAQCGLMAVLAVLYWIKDRQKARPPQP